MPSLSYVIPNSTKWANHQLKSIYKTSGASQRNRLLIDKFVEDTIHITYGYLGNYARIFFNDKSRLDTSILLSSFILDHAYVPPSLKGSVFRVARADNRLTPFVFHNKSLLPEIDEIRSYLQDLQGQTSVKVSIQEKHLSTLNNNYFSLYIKPSAMLNALFTTELEQDALRMQSLISSSPRHHKWIKCFKNHEVFVDSKGETTSASYECVQATVFYKSLKSVYCPTSMFAVPFILNSIPVFLSPYHPLFGMLGYYIPPLRPVDALNLVLSSIMATSVSINRFSFLEDILLSSSLA